MHKLMFAATLLALASAAAPASAVVTNSACAFGDVSLTIGAATYHPTRCADNVANGSPAQETSAMNSTLATSGFVFLAKSNDTVDAGALGGVTFSITAPLTNSGSWTVAWVDAAGSPNLPLTIDLEIGLFGGSNGSDYLLTGVVFPVSPLSGTGTFDINFANHGGQQPDLSHLTMTGGNVRTQVTTVPEPMSLALIGSGLVGLGVARRARSA